MQDEKLGSAVVADSAVGVGIDAGACATGQHQRAEQRATPPGERSDHGPWGPEALHPDIVRLPTGFEYPLHP